MPQFLKASEQNLRSVFDDEYLFEIPLYQRPYAWTTDEVDELLDDLFNSRIRDPKSPYFLGSIVLIKGDDQPESAVVDGQQRLTTLTMILCVLRELSESDKQRDQLDNLVWQEGAELQGTEDRFRLSLRERDREFFETFVQRPGGIAGLMKRERAGYTDSELRITENVERIRHTLARIGEHERWQLAMFIVQMCYLVVVTATDRDAAYRIFSVMNDRGLDLSPTDILKAETIGELRRDEQGKYGEKWENLEERLGRDEFRELFVHIRMIYGKDKLRQTLQEGFRNEVLSKTNGREFIDGILEPYVRAYSMVRDATYESTKGVEEINRYLRYLGLLDNFDWIPPAMEYFRRHEAEPERLLEFLKCLDRLAYGLFVQRENVTGRINRYAEVLWEIEAGEDLFGPSSRMQLTDTEKLDIQQQLGGDVYLVTRARLALLLRLDGLLAGTGASYEFPIITVEHVLPQNPAEGSEWMDWFPKENVRQEWTHKLANLVLLNRRKNSEASNWEFGRKKTAYFSRKDVVPFALTVQVLAETEWTIDVLTRRQAELIEVLSREWRLS